MQPLSFASSYANTLPIEVDGTTNTGIDAAANGVPIVNIAAPNSGGLSHNKFNSYNVNPSGLVINNATGNQNQLVQTQIGGLITDNPNLVGSGSARVILNEVTSTNRSILNGYTEIGGLQADLIIANPNGIEMNSAGFINIGRLTAVVGSTNQFNPNPSDLSFNLNGNKNSGNGFLPKLTLSGLGLDVSKVTETDLVANIMEIVSPIYGGDNRINFRAGDEEFNYNTKEVTSDNSSPGSNQPDEVAIDASNVAKIQAGQIYMIATKEGFGVKYTGDMLASRAGVTIDAKGNIVYGNTASESGNIEVKTTNGNITATGITHNKDVNSDVKLEASNDVNNQGQIVSARDVNVTAGSTFNNTGTEINLSERDFIVESKEVNNNSTMIANKGIIIKTSDKIIGSGSYEAIDNILLESADININQVSSNKNITLTGGNVTVGNIIAGEKIDINASGILTNNNQITSLLTDTNLNGIEIDAASVTSQIIQTDSNILLNATSDLTNNNLIRANNVVLVSDTLNNLGNIESLGDVYLNITTSISSNDIKANNNITLASKDINSNNIIAGNIIDITSSDLFTNNNQITSLLNDNSKTSIKINAADFISKTIETNSNVEVTTTNKAQISDLIKGYNLTVNVKELENSGDINALNNVYINSNSITSNNIISNNNISLIGSDISSSNILAGNLIDITATGSLTNNSVIKSFSANDDINAINIIADQLVNSIIETDSNIKINVNDNVSNNDLIKGNNIVLTSNNLDNLGSIAAINDVNLDVINSINSNYLGANNNITIVGESIDSNNIIAGNLVDIIASGLFTNNNQIISLISNDDETSIKINAADLISEIIDANGSVEVAVANRTQSSGLIKGYNVNLNTKELENNGDVNALNNVIINSDIITSNALVANNDINLTGNNITSNQILASGKIDINASGLLTNNHQIISFLTETNLNGIEIDADSLSSKIIQSDSNLLINIVGDVTNNNLIRANNVVLVSDTLNNLGSIESLNDVNLNIATSINSNNIKANNDITLASKDITSNNIIAENVIDITTSDLFTNNNQITSLLNDNSKTSIKINAADFVSKTIETNSNVEVTTTNKAQISDLIKGYNLTVNSSELENNGNISSLNNINIISDIIASNIIIANNDITITGNQITNNDSIIAGNKINLTSYHYLTNNNDILSLVSGASENSLIINALTLNNNKRIAANSILTINSNSLNNNTANSLIISGGNTNLNITNLDNNLGTTQSKNNLKIRNLTSNNADAALLLSVSDTNTNISNSGTLKAINSIDINLGSSNYNIIGKLETDGFINLQANNITNQGDIGAIDYIKIVANDSFTNGINGGDNSNIKIAANNYLDIEANNNINNYAILSAKTILSVKSLNGNINNYNGAELLASNEYNPGTSQLILEAINGAINQYSPNSVVVNGDHTITSYDYTNTGRIDIAGTLIMDIAHDLINEIGALIYAGNNMFLNIGNDLTNKTNATIYAENNLTISNPNAADNKINKLENISANIETYEGDITINAKTIENKREYLPWQGGESLYLWTDGHTFNYGHHNHYWKHKFFRSEKQGSIAQESFINAKNNLVINSNILTNNSSSIYAGKNITINTTTLNNISNIYRDYVKLNHYRIETGWNEVVHSYFYNGNLNVPHFYTTINENIRGVNYHYLVQPNIVYNNRAYSYNANIKAGGNLLGTVTSHINNNTIAQNVANIQSVTDRNAGIVNGLDISATLSSGTITYVLNDSSSLDQNEVTSNLTSSGLFKSNLGNSKISSNITSETLSSNSNLTSNRVTSSVSPTLIDKINGPDNQGMFQKSTNPNSPLFETRSQFVDQSKFFGSDYFYQKIGLNLTDVQTEFEQQNKRLVGDEFFQTKIIDEQLKTIRKNALLLSDSGTNVNTEIQSLLDNAADEYTRLGLTANETLTQTQIDSLEKDIVWFETETINGELYVVPKIYLTIATRDSLNNNDSLTTKSTIMAMGDLQLDSNSLVNAGSVIGNNVAISTTNDITNNNFSEVIATNGLNLTSNSGSIVNFSKLKAGGAVSLTAANNITNTSTVKTNAANLLDSDNPAYISNGSAASNSGNISSTLFETAVIEAGSLAASAGNNFNNYGANITTTGDTSISAGNNLNIETVQLRNRSEHYWGNKKKGGVKITDTTTNIGSNINTGGNLVLASTNDTLIKGSDINVDGNATINTIGDLNIVSATDSYYKFEASHKKGSFGRRSSSSSTINKTTNIESNINVAGNINSNSQENINIIASNLTSNTGDINLTANKSINILAGQDTSYSKTERNKKGTTIIKSSTDIAYDITNVHSDLNANGNIALTSGTNTNLVGTNLDAGNNIDINAGDEVMVAAVADESYRYSNSTKTRSMATVAKYTGISAALKTAEVITDAVAFATQPMTDIGLNAAAPIASGMVNYAQNLAEGDLNSKTINNVTQTKTYQLAKLNAGNNLNVTSNNNVNLIGTDIDAVDATITSTNGDVNIANVKDSSYNKSTIQKSKTTMSSLATDVVKNSLLAASTIVTSMNMLQHPDAKKQTVEDNTEAMGQKSQKQFTQINSSTDETVVASTIDVNNLTINSGRDTIITSSDINTTNNLDLNSTNNTTITSDFENDSSFTLTEKKNPNVIAALSNGIVKVVGDAMPDFSFKKPDEEKQQAKEQRENDSLDHNPHSQDISVATNTDNAMVNGYTISNNNPDELAYDTDLDKRTVKTKTYISSNLVSGSNIDIDSTNGNNTIIAANLTANNDININATSGENLVTSATNESFVATSEVEQDYNDISANYNRGRVSLDAETSIYEKDSKSTTTTQVSSNITSGGDININTKDDINVLSSNLNSNNEINLNSTQGNTNIAANKNTQNSETEIREGTLTLSAGVGHVAVDAAYAVDDTVKAAENLKKAKENLSRMKRLQKEGKATKDAVDDAEANLVVANLNVTLAGLKALAAAEKASKSAQTLGFYADAQLIRTGDKTNITSNSSQEVASNLVASNDININSGSTLVAPSNKEVGNTNIKGNVQSINSDINITSFNDTNIMATKSESSSATKTEGFTQTVSLGASYGNSSTQELINSITAQISKRSGKSDSSNVNYTNTNILASSGTININSTNNDTNISGANVNADNIIINSGNNLNVASLQNTSKSKSKSKSVGASGGSGSGSLSYNSNKSSFERNWVDDQTNIVAGNNLTINTANNTDVKGALIASNNDNLLINTGTFTYSDIIDTEKQESSGFGISTNISVGESSRNPDTGNPNQDKNYYPNGSTSLSLSNEGYEKEQVTRATIGNGTINITDTVNQIQDVANLNRDTTKAQEIKKDTITGALNVSATVDNRLIAAAFGSEGAQDSLVETIKVGSDALLTGKVLKKAVGDVGIIYDNTKKVICEDCFYEKEVKRLVESGNTKSATTKDYLNSKEVKDFVKSVEKSTKKDITKMTNSTRISELEKLSNQKDPLTNKDMRYRDALWATAKDDSKWIDFRSGHVEKITKAIVGDKSYINNKRLWSNKSDKGKLDYFETVLEKQQTIFGDKRTIGVGIKPHITNNPNSNGSYDDRKNKITIYNTSSGFDDFYKINSTMVHEYGGHGYQDYILENKKSFTKNNPQFNDTVKMFELSYDPKTWTRKGITYPNQSLHYSIYRSDPTERDAFYMGDNFKAKIIANDINSINKKITKNGK